MFGEEYMTWDFSLYSLNLSLVPKYLKFKEVGLVYRPWHVWIKENEKGVSVKVLIAIKFYIWCSGLWRHVVLLR
jgi:hypothetical protein